MMRFLQRIHVNNDSTKIQESYGRFLDVAISRFQSHVSNVNNRETDTKNEAKKIQSHDSGIRTHGSDDEDSSDSTWRVELEWLGKTLEPALQLARWALPTGNGSSQPKSPPPSTRSVSEIIASIQRSKLGFQDWSLSDLTVGLYLVYLRQTSTNPLEDVTGVQISSDAIVQDLIYHTELAKGAYKDSTTSLARNCMLRESNVLKFVKNSSVLRPGYYIGIDHRRKLVIFGIRGTHTVYDLITDIVSSSDEEITFEGYSTHFGTAEAARWFLTHEIGSIKKCLDDHKGFRLRLVGHSLGGAIASLLAIMMRSKSFEELGFSPDIVSAVAIATPPCVSKELAERCSSYVATAVMQDDIIPRLSVASLTRLRNEILETDWMAVIQKEEDWKSVIGLFSNAKQVVSSVQDVARKLADFANFNTSKESIDASVVRKEAASGGDKEKEGMLTKSITTDTAQSHEELFVPGAVYYLKRNKDGGGGGGSKARRGNFFTLWRRHPGDHLQRIVLSSNLFSDHKCDSHYHALRDVLKGLPLPPAPTNQEALFGDE